MLNALTVDVEDYFHVTAFERVICPEEWNSYPLRVEDNTSRLLRILSDRGVHATFFVLGWVAEKCPALVRRIHQAGHEIGTHGYSHRMIHRGSLEEFRRDLVRSKNILEDLVSCAVRSYRAPSYSIVSKTLWAMEVLGEEGFDYDSSIFPTIHDIYGIPNAPRFPYLKVLKSGKNIKEFPPSTLRCFGTNFPVGGGAYLRFFPYSFTSWAIRRINRMENQPALVYLHPWELDPEQPRIRASWLSSFRHYQHLHTTEQKLTKLLQEFQFGTLQQALNGRVLEEKDENEGLRAKGKVQGENGKGRRRKSEVERAGSMEPSA